MVRGPIFWESLVKKIFKKEEKVFRGFFCYPYIETDG
uniref:Uncharacterized protein n=1 Tax=viral metagenome TaxID=1070528 RepID=A0A6C0FAI4_9ZZZZ